MPIEKQPVGILFVGGKPLFDAGATLALQELRLNHDFVGGIGFGAVCAAFYAAREAKVLVDNIAQLATDNNSVPWWKKFFLPKNKSISELLNLTKLRSSATPVVVGAMNDQFFSIDPIELNKVTDGNDIFSVLRANNTVINDRTYDKYSVDGGMIDTYPVMLSMMAAGVTKLVLITSAIPESTKDKVYSQFVQTVRYNDLIKSLCLCQAQYPYMQVYMVAPVQPLLTDLDKPFAFRLNNLQRREAEIKQGYDLVKQVLGKFNADPPDPRFTAWAAVLGLQTIADRFLRSTGLEIFLTQSDKD